MSNHIFEELPTRKHAPAAAPSAAAKGENRDKQKGGTEEKSEKRVRQAVYDIRYRARREGLDLKVAFSQYMSHSSLSGAERTAVKAKLFSGKGAGVSEQYSSSGDELAVNSVASALFKVFVESVNDEKEEVIELSYKSELFEQQERKYKVRVTDLKNNRSYVRYATREKITKLRAKGLKVEMTEYGEPYEGERKRGESTASALGGGRKAKKDYDGDGRIESSSKEHAGVVHNAIQRARGGNPDGKDTRKEDYLWNEGTTSTEGQNARKIDVMKKGETNTVKVFPQDGSEPVSNIIQAGNELEGPFLTEKAKSKAQQKFMGMVYAVKKGAKPMSPEVGKAAAGMSKKEAKKFAKTKHEGLPTHKEEKECGCEEEPKSSKKGEMDVRELPTKMNMVKNKMRAMGLKMSYEPEGEQIDERRREEKGTPRKPRDRAFEIVAKSIGSGRLGVQPRGEKKEPGKKPPAAGEYGGPESPSQKVAKRRDAAQRAREFEQDTRGT